MKSKLALLLVTGALAVSAMACGSDGSGDGETTPPGETPSVPTPPSASPTPDQARPPIIDDIIEAVESGDPARLEALFVYQSVPCVTDGQGAGGPPLCRGEPDGTRPAKS